jgi:hypothetical protein
VGRHHRFHGQVLAMANLVSVMETSAPISERSWGRFAAPTLLVSKLAEEPQAIARFDPKSCIVLTGLKVAVLQILNAPFMPSSRGMF